MAVPPPHKHAQVTIKWTPTTTNGVNPVWQGGLCLNHGWFYNQSRCPHCPLT